jgi:3-oxoacyl-[acyl-carrier protein] reductase
LVGPDPIPYIQGVDANGRSANGADEDRGCVLVTGAGRGLGAAIAEALAAERPVCVNWCADRDGAAAVVSRIEAAGGRAIAVQADVSDRAAVEAMFDRAEEELGPVLVLVNNAGTRRDLPAGFLEPEDWERVIGVNLNGQFHTIHRALGTMVRRRFGRIVNVSSISAARPLPGQSAYAAAKAGVEALTRTVAIEVARRGITVNAIAPGLMNTGFVAEMDEDWSAAMPPRRVAEPEEVAGLVRYLVSPQAAYVNGTVVNIDGGLSAGLAIFSPRGRPAPAGIALDDD